MLEIAPSSADDVGAGEVAVDELVVEDASDRAVATEADDGAGVSSERSSEDAVETISVTTAAPGHDHCGDRSYPLGPVDVLSHSYPP